MVPSGFQTSVVTLAHERQRSHGTECLRVSGGGVSAVVRYIGGVRWIRPWVIVSFIHKKMKLYLISVCVCGGGCYSMLVEVKGWPFQDLALSLHRVSLGN